MATPSTVHHYGRSLGSKFREIYGFYQFPDPILFRILLAKAICEIAHYDLMAPRRRGKALSGRAPN